MLRHKDGNPCVRGRFRKGARHGTRKQWFPSGELRFVGHYSRGALVGALGEWYAPQRLKRVWTYTCNGFMIRERSTPRLVPQNVVFRELECPSWNEEMLDGKLPTSQQLADRLIAKGYAGMVVRSFAQGITGRTTRCSPSRYGCRVSVRNTVAEQGSESHQGYSWHALTLNSSSA